MKQNILIVLFFFFYGCFICKAQNVVKNTSFSVLVFEDRYSDCGKEFIQNHGVFANIKLLSGYMIDPKTKNVFDLESVERHLSRISVSIDDESILCINIENALYHNLKDYSLNTVPFKEAEDQFIKLIRLIKDLRPNLRIGIYGIPFRTYYPSQLKWNADNKFDLILSMTDIIFPSLYLLYPDIQKGINANDRYLHQNLNTAFEYADRLDKFVIPFVWYIVHPSNKQFGGELLGKSEMKRYLNVIQEYRSSESSKVNGVVWWESSPSSFSKTVRAASHLEDDVSRIENCTILREYIQHIFPN